MGSKRRPSSLKSFLSMVLRLFQRPHHVHEDEEDEPPRHGGVRVRASDEDRGRWFAEPDIDIKATQFIAKFHETRLSDLQSCLAPPLST